ncbi:hypothetical protein KC968_02500 [Candidatus Saccharibacteria bacterium]|nr:hypothetical protein [Candidatus Saccharibacteria bacterium]
MIRINRKYIPAMGLFVGLAIIIFLYNTFYTSKQLQYSPKNNNTIAGPIVIKAREKINPKSGSYTITPSVNGNLQVVDNYVIFWPEQDGGFVLDRTYQAVFKDFKTESNKTLKPVNFNITVNKKTDYDKLQKEVLEKYGRFETSFNPFLEKLPYKKDYSFRISYAINEDPDQEDSHRESGIVALLGNKDNWKEKKDNYIVYIETLVIQTQNQSYASYVEDVKQARQEAKDWIAEQGVNVEKDINYAFMPDDKTLSNPNTSREEVPLLLDDY